LGEGVPGLHPHAKFHCCDFKKFGPTAHKIAEIGIFGYKFSPNGYTPLCDFYKIWLGESQVRTLRKKFIIVALKMWAKMVIFGINLPLRENSGGPQKKLNIGAQLQTFLYAMTP